MGRAPHTGNDFRGRWRSRRKVATMDAETEPDPGSRPGRRAEPSGKPLVYSCSGCSSAAQMANALAVRLDRHGAAEMSCIAGLGGDVRSLVRLARSGRPILALDGCALVCVEATLRRHGLTPDAHIVLSRFGIRKRRHTDYDQQEATDLFKVVVEAASALAVGQS
ncbi:putative zinc-binding protein [Micromonospora sp. NPDC047548]|uniref:putative zinc-binding protein n=1 Tax=Micromonospora sp. NPDC047548 TaxID=3155624 RepID=UPI0033E0109B